MLFIANNIILKKVIKVLHNRFNRQEKCFSHLALVSDRHADFLLYIK